MKKRNILTIILILVITLFKIDVNAATCTTSEKSDLKELARMIEINIVLDKDTDPLHKHTYGITIDNFNDKFYIQDNLGTIYEYSENIENGNVVGVYSPGSVITFKVYGAYGKTCAFEQLATIRVNFPYYNDYYLSPLCEGIEDFYLCQRNYSGTIESTEWFEEEIKKYKESLENKDPVVEEEPNIFEKITNYITNNPIVIVVSVVIVILIVVIIIIKVKNNKKKIKVNLNLK